jgi:hypothetical protein
MSMNTRKILLGLACLVGAPIHAEGFGKNLVVQIDIYSGRMPPVFPLEATFAPPEGEAAAPVPADIAKGEAAALAQLHSLCEGSLASVEPKPSPSRMGYRRLVIAQQVGQDTYVPVAQVYQKTILLLARGSALLCGDHSAEGRGDAYYRDEGNLEKILMGLAIKREMLPKKFHEPLMKHLE